MSSGALPHLDKLRPTAAPYEKQITFVADRPGHDLRYAIDAAKIEQEIGWVPRRRFEEGLRETVGWYLENAAWVENIQSGGISPMARNEL